MDTVAQFLTVIKNAGSARHEKVDVPASKIRIGIAKILEENGFIRTFKVAKDSKQGVMRIYLKYDENGDHAINAISRISRPGRRVYIKNNEIPVVRSGLGISIISANVGIISNKKAAEGNIGGELLCTVW